MDVEGESKKGTLWDCVVEYKTDSFSARPSYSAKG